jgi:hypothetical protein
MQITVLPFRVLVEPRIENWVDDSDPHYDFRAGYCIKYRDQGGWRGIYYGGSDAVTTWLQEHGYNQVSCTSRRHKLAGRYEPATVSESMTM